MPAIAKFGYFFCDGDIVLHTAICPLLQYHEVLTTALAASIGGKIAFGSNAGNYVRKICGGFGYEGEVPPAKDKRCFSINGFSLHANTAIYTHARDRLYKIIEYIARVPLSIERLGLLHIYHTGETSRLVPKSKKDSSLQTMNMVQRKRRR